MVTRVLKNKAHQSIDIRLENRSKQQIGVQVKPPNGDFFVEEHQIRLSPAGKKGSTTVLPKAYLNWAQIENCRGRGFLSVTELK